MILSVSGTEVWLRNIFQKDEIVLNKKKMTQSHSKHSFVRNPLKHINQALI
jgi:hypothetical protein